MQCPQWQTRLPANRVASRHTYAHGGIGSAASRGASHHLAGDVAILLVICAGSRLTWLGQARHHSPATGCVAGIKCKIEGGRNDGRVEQDLRCGVLVEAWACQAHAVKSTCPCKGFVTHMSACVSPCTTNVQHMAAPIACQQAYQQVVNNSDGYKTKVHFACVRHAGSLS